MEENAQNHEPAADETISFDQTPETKNGSCPSCAEATAGWRRAQADYQNLKKETELERTERAKYANEKLLRDLLPALDQFGLAMSFTPSLDGLPEAEQKALKNWIAGLKAVQSLWNQAASQAGLSEISTDGAFDPNVHDAIGQEVSDRPEGEIVRVVQQGWRLHGKVLQPARVIVAKAA